MSDGVPEDPDTVAWYALGPDVGVYGNAIFNGHVDWEGRRRAFGSLRDLEEGDSVSVTDADGNVLEYTVQWSRLFDTSTAPLDAIYEQPRTEEEITLITCGGTFNRTTHSYESRLVVRASR